MFKFSFIEVSSNSKTGPMPVTRTDKKSCPDSCPLKKNGCYGELGHSNIWWKKLDNAGLTLDQLAHKIKKLPINILWRHDEVGDLPHIGDSKTICRESLAKLVNANKKKKGFTYTHYSLNAENIESLQYANKNGFTVNVSANNLKELDYAIEQGLPAVVIVGENSANKFTTENGNKVIVCPNQLNDKITCNRCGLCQKSDRNFSIAFKPHGIGKKKVEKVLGL